MAKQQQFLNVIDRDEAERRWRAAFEIDVPTTEVVLLSEALGRILAEDVASRVDVPFFDRSNLDGFAVQAADTYGVDEEHPVRLQLIGDPIATAVVPQVEIKSGEAVPIATGGMLPRGADAIAMVENTNVEDDKVLVYRAVTPGRGLTFAGTDIARGETVYRRGDVLTSRETGVLAAIGVSQVKVFSKPKIGIISTGDEIIAPHETMKPGLVFDSNARVLADAVRELGGEPIQLGIVGDDLEQLRIVIETALSQCNLVLLSGGTSKGEGDVSYRVLSEFNDPGIVAHGVALKPGKPICLAATRGKPCVILPGFPTSAIFTFHEFVASVIREMTRPLNEASSAKGEASGLCANMATRVNSEVGRTEYLLVGLVKKNETKEFAAYPMRKGSGSVTTFARADGFVTIDRHTEIVEEGADVRVTLLGRDLELADLVVIGSHCLGLDYLLTEMQRRGLRSKFLPVGSTAGLRAVERGEADLAGIHLLDPQTNEYNVPFLSEEVELIRGYTRRQGIVFRKGDVRFEGKDIGRLVDDACADSSCQMVNRNQGSGTRILIDQLLEGRQPSGYAIQSKSHNAVAASVSQQRSDWGVAIETVAEQNGLGFVAVRDEEYDFAMQARTQSTAVEAFRELLSDAAIRAELAKLGFQVSQ